MEPLKQRIQEDMKSALRSGDKRRLGTLRLVLAAIKQREVDERIDLDDDEVTVVLERMIKQRRDSIVQYQAGARQDLVDQESFEIAVIQSYLPAPLSAEELAALVDAAIREVGGTSPKDVGKVMGALKARIRGRADMSQASALVKDRLQAVH
jgi:uncharacterized protein YqeY